MCTPNFRPSPTESRTCSPKWLTHSTTRSIPFSRSSRNWCQRNGSPLTSTSDFGMVSVKGRKRVASPPARIATGSMKLALF